MSRYVATSTSWATPSETSGSIQNVSNGVTIEVTSNAEGGEGLVLAPMQIVNFEGTIYVRSGGNRKATFTVVPFKIAAGGGGGGGGGSTYTLPTASATVKGGIKVGSGLTIDKEVLSADKQVGDWEYSKKYAAGDTIIKDGKIYKCNTTHTSTDTFDPTKWDSTSADIASWTSGAYYGVGSTVIYDGSIYMCKTAHTSSSSFDSSKFTAIGGGGSGDAVLSESITANTASGAISVNEVVAKGTTFTEFVKQLLISEIAPTTTFTATNSGLVKKGDSVTTVLTLKVNSVGTGTPIFIDFMEGSSVINTQEYVAGTSTYTYTPTNSITSTTTFKAVLNYKKSDGANATLVKTQTFTFVDPVYFGAVTTAPTTDAEVLAVGNETVANKRGRTVTYTLANQKSCYCYPASLGALTSIKDANNFEYISSYDRTTVTVSGVSYYVYTLKDPVTITGFKQIFA